MGTVTLPFAPIETRARQRWPWIETDNDLARYLGCSRGAIARYRTQGVSHNIADRLCTRHLGIHPETFYRDQWAA